MDPQVPSTSSRGPAAVTEQPERQTEEEKSVEPKAEPGPSSASPPRLERDARTPSPQPGPSTAADLPTPTEAQRSGGFRDGAPIPMADDLHLDCLSSDTEPEDEDEDVTVVTIARRNKSCPRQPAKNSSARNQIRNPPEPTNSASTNATAHSSNRGG